MLMILKICIPQTYYKEHVHDMIYKKIVQLFQPFRNHELFSYPSVPGKRVGSVIKSKITEHTETV